MILYLAHQPTRYLSIINHQPPYASAYVDSYIAIHSNYTLAIHSNYVDSYTLAAAFGMICFL